MPFLLRLFHKTNKGLLRWYSRSKRDPGINLRKKLLNVNEELEFDFDDLETDFMNVHKTHKEHVIEMEANLEKEKLHIIKQKYFKEKSFNFLTWQDKEQIRYLHNTDPEEWSIEKLSEGFPALPDGIKKILKSKWTIEPARITSHDKSVQKNWEDFKNGQIPNLPKELIDHLNKFTNRALNFKPFELHRRKTIINSNAQSVGTEFSEIISSYEELKAKNTCKDTNPEITINKEISSNINSKQVKTKYNRIKDNPITLYQLQNKLEHNFNSGKKLSEDENILLKNLKQPSQDVNTIEININHSNLEDITKNKYETSTGAGLMKKQQRDFNHLIYPERITIPKDQRKKGYTYKLNDCYYDEDGLFLYRVPGMY